ncbi:hypothetical protein HanRHA438_Chr05g0233771 [Helianthus annuus]|uniref:Uncharacterized protein n=1 Tax=Helianthus annuus TaxID=4232 RepID=A0A9K3J0K3_HELAN|nr:uncharacterized protein LOC110939376 [Helianthus annuus]KAF5806709.1 hypothetical protein HanXRQr2_Chr05g0224781 [Helianthus annuus]KAJ0585292.1 hypothetical protein HanHA89_Chr05g0198701 [Helianthus annuus]KAJ0919795.1 hypothetical protein HanRHA438_Chr05g0233771 [Helianthus annuus]
MVSCDPNDVVEDEKMKMNMLHRLKLYLNIANLLQLIELFIAVALIFWSSSRIISVLNDLNLSGDNLLTFSSNLFNQHIVFLVGNVIIVACYMLSRRTEQVNRSEKLDEEYNPLSHRKTTIDGSIGDSVTVTVTVTPPSKVTEETYGEEKPNGAGRYESSDVVITESETETAIEVAVKQAVKRIERFRRTESEKLKREMSVKPPRRSATTERLPEMVEKMSNEEFRHAVETFILKQQRLLKLEGMDESGIAL